MALDGVKIIDSDSAHDIHIAITEGWKDGKAPADLIAEVRAWERDFCFNPLETEIYWTALAYSLWKIGHLPADIQQRTLQIISEGATADWLKIDPKAQKQRQKELTALAEKIRQPNPKPLRRPKLPKTPKQPFFSPGDVLSVALPTGKHGACVLVQLTQTPRKIDYNFSIVNLRQPTPPTLDDVLNAEISCRGGIDPKNPKDIFFDASCWTEQKTVGQVLPHLRRIGQVELISYNMGSYSPALGIDGFFDCWDGFSVNKNCRPMRDCIKNIISENPAPAPSEIHVSQKASQ